MQVTALVTLNIPESNYPPATVLAVVEVADDDPDDEPIAIEMDAKDAVKEALAPYLNNRAYIDIECIPYPLLPMGRQLVARDRPQLVRDLVWEDDDAHTSADGAWSVTNDGPGGWYIVSGPEGWEAMAARRRVPVSGFKGPTGLRRVRRACARIDHQLRRAARARAARVTR